MKSVIQPLYECTTAQVYFKMDKLYDSRKIVSRRPAGARPNKPRTAYIGLNLAF